MCICFGGRYFEELSGGGVGLVGVCAFAVIASKQTTKTANRMLQPPLTVDYWAFVA